FQAQSCRPPRPTARSAASARRRKTTRARHTRRISVPTEVRNTEFGVASTAAGVHELAAHGHEVTVQAGAGEGSFITGEEYSNAGASIAADAAETWAAGELVLKVKEPIEQEYEFLRKDLILFTYLHLAADEAL